MLGTVGTIPLASSEGIPTEYVAIFLAVLFPGALVALNYELLEGLQPFTALRVYCAGIWHNVVCCAVCGLVLFLLPYILCPFYIHGERLMVLDVASTSPLSGYLSPGDIIISLDGKHVHNEQDWMGITALIDQHPLQSTNVSKSSEGSVIVHQIKGYCVPTSVMEESSQLSFVDSHYTCPNDLTEFVAVQCFDSSKLDNVSIEDGLARRHSRHCLNAKDVVKLNKCGDEWVSEITNGSSCLCPEVFFLDGESILEAALCHYTYLSPRKRVKVLRACLFLGTLVSSLVFLKIFIHFW